MSIASNEYSMKVSTNNCSGNIKKLIIEPWGTELSIKPNEKIEIIGTGPKQNAEIELEYEGEVLVVYAWTGATLSVFVNDNERF